MKSLSCNRVQERLGDYFHGRISRLNKDALRVHLAVCETCREYAKIWSGLEAAVRDADLPPLPSREEQYDVAGAAGAGRTPLV